ncbi:MAG: monovalent cation:proton antiporter-2 (CPA2) family protein [Pseudomonadota bacterium]
MDTHDTVVLFSEALILLGAAVIAVPISKRLGLGSVLGYLIAGIIIGPEVLRLFRETEDMLHVSELGVVLLLFVIGLELKPSRLWSMRKDIFGLGLTQVLLSAAGVMAYPHFVLGWSWQASVIAGFGLALSSTALVMQLLDERGETQSTHGRKSFAILLFQDIAFVPILLLVAILAPHGGEMADPAWLAIAKVVGAFAVVIGVGHYLINPFFTILARSGAREIMTAAGLFIVLAAATLMALAGLSMAMGAFLAGVLLAESRFRHQLEADIEPFRGMLLGLFFIAVGMTIDLGVLVSNWAALLLGVPALIATKFLTIYAAMRLFGSGHNDAIASALYLPQGGEFGFVVYAAAAAGGIITLADSSELIAAVVLSMALTPLLVRLIPRLQFQRKQTDREESFEGAGGTVLMIGFGRFGQMVSQLLLARGIDVTTIDNNLTRIDNAARFGFKVFYGDGRRIDVLRAAGAEHAELILVCTDGKDTTSRIAELVRESFPRALLGARSFDRTQTLELLKSDVDFELRETFESAMVFGRMALEHLSVDDESASEIEAEIRSRDRERLGLQLSGDIYSGLETLLATPEPLVPPRSAPERLNPEARKEARQDTDSGTDDDHV